MCEYSIRFDPYFGLISPEQEFRSVGVAFAPGVDYMSDIVAATDDITVQLVFNNAGYICTGFFESVAVEKQLANVECNSTACVPITHHFVKKMIDQKLKVL